MKKLHFSPQKNWMNDPNGLIYIYGEYHIYYQYFPYDSKWGTMHWGHATTKDFINWNYHDIAIFPTIKEDKNGCFSGSALKVDDKVYFYYTGVEYIKANDKNIHVPIDDRFIATQLLIKSKDGYNFDNFHGKKTVVEEIKEEPIGDSNHTRDPKVWKHNENYYMILGTKRPIVRNPINRNDYEGGVLIYKGSTPEDFNLVETYYNNEIGDMWECPDFFEVNDNQLFIFSPENSSKDEKNYRSNAYITKANFDYQNNKFSMDDGINLLDYGKDFYAPQTFEDEYKNRVVIGWLRMSRPIDQSIGMFSMPRVISIENDCIKYSIHQHINQKFIKIVNSVTKEDIFKINIKMKSGEVINIHGYKIEKKIDELIFDRRSNHNDYEGIGNVAKIEIAKEEVDLEIFCDKNVIEVFVDNGKFVCTHVLEYKTNEFDINNKEHKIYLFVDA